MTPAEISQQQDALLRDHLAKMQAISDKGVANAEKWGGVIAHVADHFSIAPEGIPEILGSDLKELLTVEPPTSKGNP